MDALRLFWFFEPRMALWGLGLGTFLGAMYGLFVGVFVPPMVLLFGPLLGGGYGAIAGLALGVMEGAVLWAFTLLFHRRSKPGDTSQYLRRAGYVCAGACVLALASFCLSPRSSPPVPCGGRAQGWPNSTYVSSASR